MYHRVLPAEEIPDCLSHRGIIVKNTTFKKQMEFIGKKFNPISLGSLHSFLENREKIGSKNVLVTFDDGWKDNFDYAFESLRANNIPAVIYLPTDYIGTHKRFWQETITHLLLEIVNLCKGDDSSIKKSILSENIEGMNDILSSDPYQLKDNIENFVSLKKKQSKKNQKLILSKLRKYANQNMDTSQDERDFMNWEEVRKLSMGGIDFGSHGQSHSILTNMINNKQKITLELSESKKIIEQEINKEIISFAYPNGQYSKQVVNVVHDVGYKLSFSTENGVMSLGDNPYTLKRINMHENMTNSIPMFLARIIGLW